MHPQPLPRSGGAAAPKNAPRARAPQRRQPRREVASRAVLFDRRDIRGVLNLEQVYLSEEEFEQFFEALDADGDGRVTLLDYLKIPEILDTRMGFCPLYA